jgi:hypothetical protein
VENSPRRASPSPAPFSPPAAPAPVLAALALAALAGCTSGPLADGPGGVTSERRALITGACQTRHVIAEQKGSSDNCVRQLQAQGGEWRGRPLVARPRRGGGDVFCGYTWVSPAGLPPDFAAFNRPLPGEVAVELDCPVLRPAAPAIPPAPGAFSPEPQPLDPDVWRPLQKAFHLQAGVVRTKQPRASTAVAVIDSAAHAFDDVKHDNYGHGRLAGRIIADLACSDPKTCDQRVVNKLALPHLTPAMLDYQDGGFFGTRGQLAEAITGAVDGWRAAGLAGKAIRQLVVNLSLGWDPAAVAEDQIPSGVTDDAVYTALARASCYGALAVAAAGNSDDVHSGPVLPAAWEERPAPGPSECAELGIGTAQPPPPPPPRLPTGVVVGKLATVQAAPSILTRANPALTAAATRDPEAPSEKSPEPGKGEPVAAAKYRPLVYAAGGVDPKDMPLTSTRPLGKPRLASYGWNVVTDDPVRSPGHTVIMSGSSMAAAVLSGVVAAAWDAAPGMDGHTLMQLIYDTGVALKDEKGNPAHPDFCFGGGCGGYEIRRVSACAAVQAVQPGTVCWTVPAHGGVMPALPDLTASMPPVPIPGQLARASEVPEGDPPDPSDPTPPPPLGSAPPEDWVMPQPNWPRCQPCQIGNTGLVMGTFDPTEIAASGSVVTDIYVWTGSGGYWQSVNPAAVVGTEAGFARLIPPATYSAGWIVFNVVYVEYGVYVRAYQTPMQNLALFP